MTKARDIASATTPNANAALLATFPHKNLIINGAMQVAQRGTSETGVTSTGYYTVDRFQTNTNLGTFTETQSTDAPSGFYNSKKIECTTASALSASSVLSLEQKLEGYNLQQLAYGTSDAQEMTLSFWVKSNKTGTYTLLFLQPDASNRQLSATYTVNSSATWEYKTISIPADTSGSISNDNGTGFRILWYVAAGSNRTSGSINTTWDSYSTANEVDSANVNLADTVGNYFQITGVQLEIGDTATPFEHRSYAEELTRCHRYAIRYRQDNQERGFEGSFGNGTNTRVTIKPYVPMRATPTMTVNDAGESLRDFVAWYAASSATLLSSTNNEFINVGVTHADTGLPSAGNTVAWWGGFDIVLDAEL